MHKWTDYYRLLQVHYLAEPEVIECAYKRLARKYHPDVNKNADSEQVMKLINEAYDVLIDPIKRKRYHYEWETNNNKVGDNTSYPQNSCVSDRNITMAKDILSKYLSNILNNNFEDAYELISSMDKNNINLKDFLQWQSTVSRIFKLKSFECKANNHERNVEIDGLEYKATIDFIVAVSEYNTIMDRFEKDFFIKKVVLEKEAWYVYMGYEGVQPLITKFESLTNLLSAKTVINELVESYSNLDLLTGVFNKKGFVDLVEKEMWRNKRYGNIFSLMMCEIKPGKIINTVKKQDGKQNAIVWLSKLLISSFRKTDVVGRWGENTFVVLLPEARLSDGLKAAEKVRKILNTKRFMYDNKSIQLALNFSLVEVSNSLDDTIQKLICYLGIARKLGDNNIVTAMGVYK